MLFFVVPSVTGYLCARVRVPGGATRHWRWVDRCLSGGMLALCDTTSQPCLTRYKANEHDLPQGHPQATQRRNWNKSPSIRRLSKTSNLHSSKSRELNRATGFIVIASNTHSVGKCTTPHLATTKPIKLLLNSMIFSLSSLLAFKPASIAATGDLSIKRIKRGQRLTNLACWPIWWSFSKILLFGLILLWLAHYKNSKFTHLISHKFGIFALLLPLWFSPKFA